MSTWGGGVSMKCTRTHAIIIFGLLLTLFFSIGNKLLSIDTVNYVYKLVLFLAVSVLPGYLLLTLQEFKAPFSRILLYSIGLSIAIIMIIGVILSLFNLTYDIIVAVIKVYILTILWISIIKKYRGKRNYELPTLKSFYPNMLFTQKFSIKKLQKILTQLSIMLILLLLPILGNYMEDPKILMFYLFFQSVVPLLVQIGIFEKETYPILIYISSLALLYHVMLATDYISGYDIHLEYYYAKLALFNLKWDWTIQSRFNSVASITILAPIYALLLEIPIYKIFKIIYPSLFSLTPVGLYYLYLRVTNHLKKLTQWNIDIHKLSFYSTFFFFSVFMYYRDMAQLLRQQIAELFIVLAILGISEKRKMLSVLFIIAMILSHYGLAFIIMFILILSKILLIFIERINNANTNNVLPVSIIFISIVVTLTWYSYIGEGHGFISFLWVIKSDILEDVKNLFTPDPKSGIRVYEISASTRYLFHKLHMYLHLISQLLALFGMLLLVYITIQKLSKKETLPPTFKLFLTLSTGMFALAGSGMIIQGLDAYRIYQISLLLLAACWGVGFNYANMLCAKLCKKSIVYYSFPLFLTFFLLLNSGLIFEISNEPSTSFVLNPNKDFPAFSASEVVGANWGTIYISNPKNVYGDLFGEQLLLGFYPLDKKGIHYFVGRTTTLPSSNNTYIYLRNINTKNKILLDFKGWGTPEIYIPLTTSPFYKYILYQSMKIYCNDRAQWWYKMAQSR